MLKVAKPAILSFALLSASSSISVQTFLLLKVLPSVTLVNPAADILIYFITSATIAAGLNRLMMMAFEKGLWKFPLRRYDINGEWRSVMPATPARGALHGTVQITQSLEEISIVGKNYTSQSRNELSYWSTWQSLRCCLDSNTLLLHWKVERKNGETATGIIYLELDGKDPPTSMNGRFIDSHPSTHEATLQLERVPS